MLEARISKELPDFDLEVELALDREILSILGPSGSGKTMTLLCIAGLARPDSGMIRLNGRTLYSAKDDIFLPAQQRKIGFVFQNYALFPHLTVAGNVAYGLRGKNKSEREEKVSELLDLVNIPGLKNRYPADLSSGQQQRVALARAVAPEPEALLLDEPFSALDAYRRERLEYELISLQSRFSFDMLFVTHDLHQGFKLGRRLAIFDEGRVVQCAEKNSVIAAPVSLTAAKLTGLKNLFSGKVTGVENGKVKIFVKEFDSTITARAPADATCQRGQVAIAGIRAEHLELVSAARENAVICRIEQQVDGVATTHCHAYAEKDHGRRFRLEICSPRLPGLPAVDGEASHHFYFPPDRVVLLKNNR